MSGVGAAAGAAWPPPRRRRRRRRRFPGPAVASCPPPPLPTLSSLLPPSELDFEIVVIDDNSPDGTQDVVRQLQQAYGEDRWAQRHAAPRGAADACT